MDSCISHFVYALAFGSFLHLVFWFSSYHELGEKDAGQHVGYTVIFVQIGHMLMMADFLYYYFKRFVVDNRLFEPIDSLRLTTVWLQHEGRRTDDAADSRWLPGVGGRVCCEEGRRKGKNMEDRRGGRRHVIPLKRRDLC